MAAQHVPTVQSPLQQMLEGNISVRSILKANLCRSSLSGTTLFLERYQIFFTLTQHNHCENPINGAIYRQLMNPNKTKHDIISDTKINSTLDENRSRIEK